VLRRLRCCEPTPHDLVHVDQAPKEPSAQSTAHGAALQVRLSAECGHALPPNVGATVARLRCCEPTPHDLVHVDQAPKAPSAQSVARLRCCEPVPHDLVQVDHAPKRATTQFTAHGAALQVRV
jgi:hypothetical protein